MRFSTRLILGVILSTDQERLFEERRRAVEQSRAILEGAEAESRDLNAEESDNFERASADIDGYDRRISRLAELSKRADADAEYADRARVIDAATPAPAGPTFEDELRSFLAGERRSLDIKPATRITTAERRSLSKATNAAGAFTVPTDFYRELWANLIEVSGILQAGATVLETESGESLQVPKTLTHSSGALTAETVAISASDPTFGQLTLGAYKYGVLIQVSNELVTDTAVDLLGYLAMQAGRAVGNAFGVHAITGTGSSQPRGITIDTTLGVTGNASVAGVFTGDNLIELMYSVIAPYRTSPNAAFMMRDASMATVRKLKDTAGQYIWQPSLSLGSPDLILGKPVYTDPNIAATGLAAKSVLFGDISQYLVRTVQGVRFERSDEYAFNTDLVTFRCVFRADGGLIDLTGAVKHFIGNAA